VSTPQSFRYATSHVESIDVALTPLRCRYESTTSKTVPFGGIESWSTTRNPRSAIHINMLLTYMC
jgi:hypothetical protein